MTINGDTICNIIQSFPVLLILAQKYDKCLNTPFIYKPPSPTQSPEYYEALDALFHNLFGHGCKGHDHGYDYFYGHGGYGYDKKLSQYYVNGYSDHNPCSGYPPKDYAHHEYHNTGHGQLYPVYGHKKGNSDNTGGYGHGYKNYSPNHVYKYHNKYKVVVKKTRLGRRNKSQKLVIEGDICQTVDGKQGSCISVLSCQPYIRLLQDARVNPAAVQVLRKAHCGFEGGTPKVCCPAAGIPTQAPVTQPTTTTTTSTTTTAGSVAGKTIDPSDYVPVLPDPPICGLSNASFSRVVGGVPAKLGDFPWMALLGYKPRRNSGVRWLCGGSLITAKHTLTAAHCIHGKEEELYLVRVGELDLAREDEGATPVDVLIKTIVKHEEYNPKAFTNDIGILILEREVQFTELIRPICIPKQSELRARSFENYNPLIAGWGDTEFRGPAASHLQVLQLPVVSNDFCAQAYSQYKAQVIDKRVLCAGYKKGGRDACQGDSGGPLMQPIYNQQDLSTFFYQIGVVSFGKKCAEAGFPGVYSRVTEFVPWIQEKVIGFAKK